MTYNLNIQNFQSIKNVSLEFEGFCIIKGRSDIGKSAVRRALGVAIYNEWDKAYIRAKEAQTHIEFSCKDRFSITVDKSKSLNHFKVVSNGHTYDLPKVGKEQPQEVANLGFSPLETSGDTYNLNVTTQLRDPLFMVAFKDSENTKILNTLFKVDVLEQAQSLCLADRRETKSSLKQILELIDEEFKGLPEQRELLNKRKNIIERSKKLLSKAEASDKFIRLSKELEPINQSFENLSNESDRISSTLEMLQKLEMLNTYISATKEIGSLGESENRLSDKIAVINSAEAKAEWVEMIERYQEINESFSELSESKSALEGKLSKFDKVRGITKLTKYLSFKDSVKQFEVEIENIKQKHEKIVSSLSKAEAELKSVVKVCEACGQPILS